MNPLEPNKSSCTDSFNKDPLKELAQLARLEVAPKTDVTANVLRQIRVQEPIVAQKPLIWLALGSSVAAAIIAAVAIPALMNLIDPLNTLYEYSSTSLM